ncbi:MAG: alanine--tRNA ligase [Bacilli bacterium]|nr:alanine--tRNA ligase [Bacilli bacterium]
MKKLSSNEIRQVWLDFFESKGHKIIDSAPLVPINDPTLLWINAGVAPLKKYFDGTEIPENRRMVNVQKSIRTNDIENVGKTARHHTFFEMLGNFSIGDYFRDEALTWGFEILTSNKYYGFDLDKLYFTVHPKDEDSYNKWIELGVNKDHIIKLEGNFWEIGEGPCGPDTEIFFDRGPKYDPDNLGIKLLEEEIENDRYIEIWNIVFSQFNAVSGKPREEYKELPSKNIDTGMGLERMACVIQEVETNYETDLFMPIIKKLEEITGVKYSGQMAFKVIADHVRSVSFAIADGAMLSNEGRGYVLRRLLRRAVRYGKKLGMNTAFMYNLVDVVADNMFLFYPEVKEKSSDIKKIIKKEEEKFLQTLESGEKKLLDYIKASPTKLVTDKEAFLLYDTFGFPIELTVEVALENGFNVDLDGFKRELARQKELSRASRNEEYTMNTQNEDMLNFKESSEFVGYENYSIDSKIIGIFSEGNLVESASGEVLLVFEKTPFYGEGGGQVGDLGIIVYNNKTFKVTNTIKLPNEQNASVVDLEDTIIETNATVHLSIDNDYRNQVIKNHTATHLLNEALRVVLGKHVHQQGSYVGSDSLRFDFNGYNLPTNEEILAIEKIVNEEIKKAKKVDINYYPIEEAKKMNVQAVFGEKYGSIVRVVSTDFSMEFCGGCHVKNTADIEKFAITSVESKGSGIYRIEASTGLNINKALAYTLENINNEIHDLFVKQSNIISEAKENGITLVNEIIELTDVLPSYETVINRRNELNLIRENVKELDKLYNKLRRDSLVIPLDDYLKNNLTINGYNVLICKSKDLPTDNLKDLVDRLSEKLENSVVLIASYSDKNVVFVCKNKIDKLHAGKLVKEAAIVAGGNGGGRNDFAQAGGKDPNKVDEALEVVKSLVKNTL